MKSLAVLLIATLVLFGVVLFGTQALNALAATGLFLLGFASGVAATLHYPRP